MVGKLFTDVPLTRQHLKTGLALFFAFVIEAWRCLSFPTSSPAIQDGLSIGSSGVGLLLSAMFFGTIPGALLWGVYVDKIGRKSACVISLIAYGVRLAASALAPDYWTLWGLRYVSGFALADILVTVFLYFEELIPVRFRSRATSS